MPSPYPARLPRGSPPAHRRQRRPGGGTSRGAGNDTTSSASGTCRTSRSAPGAPTEGQGETATARPTGRRMRRDDGTPPPRRGEGRPRQRKPGKASGGCPLRQRPPGVTPRSGRVPHPFPSTHRRRTGRRGEGPAGRHEKSGPIRQGMSVPRLARLRPGPGERDVTTSIVRQQKTGRGAASEAGPPTARRRETRRGQPSGTRACASAPPRKPFVLSSRRGGESTVRGDGARDVQQPARAGPRRTAFARAAGTGGGESGFGSRPRSSRGHPPSSNHPRTACPQSSRGTKCQL